jgi:hypothetical protein
VYYRTLLGDRWAEIMRGAAGRRYASFLESGCDTSDAGVELLLEPLQECFGDAVRRPEDLARRRFDWRRVFEPVPVGEQTRTDGWRDGVIAFMRQDIANAEQGNLRNPIKAACDGVWRDLRSVLCEAADRGGLTPASQRRFTEIYLRYYNRLSNGAGLEPMRRMLALVECGLLDLTVGPAPLIRPAADGSSFRISGQATCVERSVDVLIYSRMDPFDARRDLHPLYPNLLRRGLVRQWRNPGCWPEQDFVPGGLDLCQRLHPLRDDGTRERRLTFVGAPTTGLLHFQQTAARPHAGSAPLNTVADWAGELVTMCAAQVPVLAER